MHEPETKTRARQLRLEKGMPFKQIAVRVGISVATAHAWTRDIELTDEQRLRSLAHMTPASEVVMKRAETWRAINRLRRLSYQESGRQKAREGDPLHQAGCMLYWAEGSKERNSVLFSNSDVEMLRFFWRFLRSCFGLGATDVTLRLNVYTSNGPSISQVEAHWLQALELPSSCVRKHTINHLPTSSSGRKENKLPHGVCTLRVLKSTWLVQHIYGAIQEYAGFEEPRWLDGPPRKPRTKAR
jgi:transcriptional regulator with XRE-family HTH domain